MKNEYFPDNLTPPGTDLQEKLEELDITTDEFASISGLSRNVIEGIIRSEIKIDQDISLKLESVLKIPANYWLNSQMLYDKFSIFSREERQT